MFLRSASRRELYALTRAMDIVLPLDVSPIQSKKRTPNEEQAHRKAYLKQVSDAIKKHMLSHSLSVVLDGLRDPDMHRNIAAEMQRQLPTADNEEGLLEFANALNQSIFSVAEKDFLQLTHGQHSVLLAAHRGIDTILGGIILGLFYGKVPPTKTMSGLVARALVEMISVEQWSLALKYYGPAPLADHVEGRRRATFNVRPHQLHHAMASRLPVAGKGQ